MEPTDPYTPDEENGMQENLSPQPPPESSNLFFQYVLPVLLLIATCFVTVLAGAYQVNAMPVEGPWDLFLKHPDSLVNGLPYALTLLTILFTHRFGYYILSRHYKIPALLPLFLPNTPNFIGGGGAFIRINPTSINRKALFDISVSGTIIGFLVATLSLIIGLFLSTHVPRESSSGLNLGESLSMKGLAWLIHGDISADYDIVLHPIGFAGWYGLFVINVCLIPYFRTDGAFVGQAVWGKQQQWVNWVVVAVFIILGAFGWLGWLAWLIALPLMGLLVGKRIPPVEDPEAALGAVRKKIGWGVALIFILTFMPLPFYFG